MGDTSELASFPPGSVKTISRSDASSGDRPTLAEPNLEYWRTTNGAVYQELIRQREGNANPSYQQQEAFLAAFMRAERQRKGSDIRALEFGCGFGRHARYLAVIPGISYFGYDISEQMVEPLRRHPPSTMAPLEHHLFVGPDVRAAVGTTRFDVVFTVSVLIHNPPERVPDLLEAMTSLLSPTGALVLIENRLVPTSVFENSWHQGCWLHCFPQLIPAGYDLVLGQGLITTHDIYILRHNDGGPSRIIRFQDDKPLTTMELDAMSVPKIRAWAQSHQGTLSSQTDTRSSRASELEELLQAERRRTSFRARLSTLSEDLAALRTTTQSSSHSRTSTPEAQSAHEPPAILWDEPVDTHYAQRDIRFSRVVHVFHQEWHGIRAHAGYSPGQKVAITSRRRLTPAEMRQLIEGINDRLARVVVFQGYSETTAELAVLLRNSFGKNLTLAAAWLGNTAQLHVEFEHAMFRCLLEQRERGTLDALACVKADMHLISPLIFPNTLLSLPPHIEASMPRMNGLSGTAFIPVPNDWRKNFYTNLYAATLTSRLKAIQVTTEFSSMPGLDERRVTRINQPQRAQVLRLMRDADVVLNATLSECQPMTALEALAVGTPCLIGPINLGALDLHPFRRLTQVCGVDSVRELRDAIERVLDFRENRPAELSEMMTDYLRCITRESLDRYCEFLKL